MVAHVAPGIPVPNAEGCMNYIRGGVVTVDS